MSDTILDSAVGWIANHLEEFDPLQNSAHFDFARGQRLGELAILGRTMATMAAGAGDPRVHRMVDLLRRTQSSPVYRDRILRAPLEFMLFVETYATLRALGLDDELIRARLQKAIRAGWCNQTERFPHRAMDIRSCLDACGIDCDLAPLDELYRRSILGALPNPILLNEHDLYALTHVIMFLSDFGARPSDAMPRSHVEPISDLLSALVVVAARDRHWDLLAEFLLCWSCIDLPETGLTTKAWEALARAQRPDGAVPGPECEGDALLFEHTYHTTLVCALAASIRHGKACAPPQAGTSEHVDGPAELVTATAELREVAERAAAWLTGVLQAELRNETCSPLTLCQVLVGLWACSALTDVSATTGDFSRIVARLSEDGPLQAWPSLPPLLKTVSAAWAARCGFRVQAMHGAGGFLHRASGMFHNVTVGTLDDVLEMSEIWAAMHQLTLAPAPPAFSYTDFAGRAEAFPLDASASQLEALLQMIEASTASGTRVAQWAGELSWVPQLIAGLALNACRRYDLFKASSLLRIGISISADDMCARRLLRRCARYLIFNQREDGAFGFLGPELANRPKDRGSAMDETDCLLPLTVNCLLALAESSGDWRLLTALGTLAPAVQAAAEFAYP